jgi:nicotinate dehydrogenase subunit B
VILRASQPRTRQAFRQAQGVLLVLREPPPAPPPVPGQPAVVAGLPAEGDEVLLALWDDGSVTALHGHVDLGTGLRTALAQIVAEELDLALDRVHLLMGSTAAAPNQGATIASASIQVHAQPLRAAAAQARAWLQAQPEADPAQALKDRHVELRLALDTPLKDPARYRIVGQPVPRVDIAGKALGELVFVHDLRLPGMLHGRVVRPPYAGADHGEFIGNSLLEVDESSIAHLPGVRKLVVIRDFVGVVAEREEQAEAAMQALRVHWKPWPGLPPVDDIEQALRANPATPRRLVDEGDVDAAQAGAATRLERTYLWPYQLHASIGPSCAVADWREADASAPSALTVWAGTQNPHVLRADLARLTGLSEPAVDVVRMEAAGCYGRNGADDVAADAALLSRAVGAPVRVQLTREQEQAWEPKGAAQWMQVRGGLDAEGGIAGWDFQTAYPSNGAPTLALLLTRTIEPRAQAYEMGDRTARPPYAAADMRVTVLDMPPILRASWLRGVSALPNSFAHESYIDELAHAAGADPVAYRLRHLPDTRAAELVQATAQRAGWKPHSQPQQQAASGDWLLGQGFAYARYVHSRWPGFGAAWAAWVADVAVHRVSGEVQVRRVVVGHDAGLMVNPAGVQHQIHGNVLQTTSRALKEQVELDPQTHAVLNREWGSYPILSFRELPVVEVLTMPRPGEPPLGAGESSSVPGTAAIANAIFDATGLRFREPPFTPEKVRAALQALPGAVGAAPEPPAAPAPTASSSALPADAPWPRRRGWRAVLAGAAAGGLGLLAGLAAMAGLGAARSAIAPVAAPDLSIFAPATAERGRLLAAAGHCVECHTAPGGAPGAGGRAFATPFGTVYATNLTPDAATGIGAWSLPAFTRALREGRSRDGHGLYPVFPYTAFARLSDDDITALYAHLMAQPAVAAPAIPANAMRFPFGFRPLMSLWNGLFHEPAAYQADPARSAEWNRGAYLVEGIGHCGACHTPRNALGAEARGARHLGGAVVDGWEAPALTARNPAPVAWTAAEFFRYLRSGDSAHHGAAVGSMATVVRDMQVLPDADLQAMASYMASFQAVGADPAAQAEAALERSRHSAAPSGPAQRMFERACGACHHDGDGPQVFGLNLPLALNSNLHSARPDNLLRTILQGVSEPARPEHGHMPAFGGSLSDAQIAELAAWMRLRFAPDQPAWTGLPAAVARLRAGAA